MNLIQQALLAANQPHQVPTISMEQELLETSQFLDMGREIETDANEVNRATELVQALEDLEYVIDSIKGEPTPREAALIQIVGDAATAGTGVSGDTLTPAMEDAGSLASNIGEKIKNIIKAIRDILVAMGKKIAKFVSSFLATTGNLNGRYQELGKRLGKLSKSASNTKTVLNYGDVPNLNQEIAKLASCFDVFVSGSSTGRFTLMQCIDDIVRGSPQEVIDHELESAKRNMKVIPGGEHIHDDLEIITYESTIALGDLVFSSHLINETRHFGGNGVTARHALHKIAQLGYDVRTGEAEHNASESNIPNIAELREMHKALGGLMKHLSTTNIDRTLISHVANSDKLWKKHTEEVLKSMERPQFDTSLAGPVQTAIARMTSQGSSSSVRALQICRQIVNRLMADMFKAVSLHEEHAKG